MAGDYAFSGEQQTYLAYPFDFHFAKRDLELRDREESNSENTSKPARHRREFSTRSRPLNLWISHATIATQKFFRASP